MSMEELGRRAIACKHWRWMPGMLTEHGRVCGAGYLVSDDVDEVGQPFVDCTDTIDDWSNLLPDLTDPATLGCLLALVREAWGEPALSVTAYIRPAMPPTRPRPMSFPRKVEWEVEHPQRRLPEALWTYFDTEAEALVAALEAAP